ncbi:LOG family protein [Rhizobium leguminosarum]|uniref:LOG family protein n=1 Tax=Rhizobium leguminosarum TaxID=384 RepID=UPI001030090A|nr:LOG family protein [Rhizobium leguminosarum]TAX53828.1 LOG family protein [Rhizobium leguminosarum]TAX58586.1 LOG family protein [Rhizobium leguminosarum]TAX99688.1 LOG family protein [Rhizobium leguminosarum]
MAKGRNGGSRRKDGVWDPLKSSSTDKQRAEAVPKTPQTLSPAYRLAYVDEDFLCREELRPIRLQLELLKTEMMLTERGIKSTVVMFGGARIPAPGQSAWAARNDIQRVNLEAASVYYDEARKFARLCSKYSATLNFHEYVIVTGGGPGVMEAGNRGAADEGAPSIGLNIVLPHEQAPNAYVTPELSFNFHYFAIRKMHFMVRAKAIAVFPGGFGTLDEFFECLTLIQTGRMESLPLILFGEAFWRSIINFDALAEFGTIAPDDVKLISFVDTAEAAWKIVQDFYEHRE